MSSEGTFRDNRNTHYDLEQLRQAMVDNGMIKTISRELANQTSAQRTILKPKD